MIIKNREERSNAVWQFIGIAAIPVVLFFLAGFSLGNTSKIEHRNWKSLYDAKANLVDSLQKQIALYNAFFNKGDATLAKVEEKMNELDQQLETAVTEQDNEAIIDWEEDKTDYLIDLNAKLAELEAAYVKKNPQDTVLGNGMKYFREFKRAQERRLSRRKEEMKGLLTSGKLAELEAKEAELDQKAKDLESEAEKTKSETEKMKLERDLDACRRELDALRTPVSEKDKNNGAARQAIATEVTLVENEIIKDMQANVIFGGDRKKIDRLRESLRTRMTNIKREADKIKP